MIRRIARFLLRREIGALRAENAAFAKEARDLDMEATRLHCENVELRKRALRPDPTPAEARMLAIVRANPGLLAPDLGMLAHRDDCDRARADAVAEHGEAYATSGWWNRPFSRGDHMPSEASRALQTLHKKNLVRREKAGNTFRYWVNE